MGSESSSPEADCAECGHWRDSHDADGTHCRVCHTVNSQDQSCTHPFVPADAETAGESEEHEHDWSEWGAVYHGGHFQWRTCFSCRNTECRKEGHSCPECTPEPERSDCRCTRESGCREKTGVCLHGCMAAADDVTRLGEEMEPEAPVCSHDRWSKFYEKCMDCGFAPEASASGAKEAPCEGCEHPDHGDDPCGSCPCGHSVPQPAPRRSPYAVAYELQDGSAFEIALPGDATVRADDGLLIIHHAQSPVKGLVQVKPWGDQ